MRVKVQKATAEGCRFITLPDNVLKAMGWKEGDDIYIEPVFIHQDLIPSHIVLEKR